MKKIIFTFIVSLTSQIMLSQSVDVASKFEVFSIINQKYTTDDGKAYSKNKNIGYSLFLSPSYCAKNKIYYRLSVGFSYFHSENYREEINSRFSYNSYSNDKHGIYTIEPGIGYSFIYKRLELLPILSLPFKYTPIYNTQTHFSNIDSVNISDFQYTDLKLTSMPTYSLGLYLSLSTSLRLYKGLYFGIDLKTGFNYMFAKGKVIREEMNYANLRTPKITNQKDIIHQTNNVFNYSTIVPGISLKYRIPIKSNTSKSNK